jgi:hypothetical protein
VRSRVLLVVLRTVPNSENSTTKSTKPGEQRVGNDLKIENGVTQPVTYLRTETNLRGPIESGRNLVCLVSLVFPIRILGP